MREIETKITGTTNFARIWYKQEELILKAAGTLQSRIESYTKRTDRRFIDRLEQAKPSTKEALNKAWFGYANPNPGHYDSMRYYVKSKIMLS